jgi:predicted nucleotidyltransferase
LSRDHYTDYNEAATGRCERALLTLIGDLGPWRERIYLAGGLAPRYLVGQLPEGVPAHVGTTDVDLVIGLALGDETPETYRTLQNNLEKALFEQQEPSFRWARQVEGVTVLVEFLCETDEVPWGRIYKPKGEYTGSKLGAFNVRGAHLVRDDFVEQAIEGERLDGGGQSRVFVRVANVLPYTVLKIFAFQDRHENKDAYDLVFTLLNHQDGPRGAGRLSAASPVAQHPQVVEALLLLEERFRDANQDGPNAYASFLANPDDEEEKARLRQQAVATVRAFLSGLRDPTARSPVGDRQSET